MMDSGGVVPVEEEGAKEKELALGVDPDAMFDEEEAVADCGRGFRTTKNEDWELSVGFVGESTGTSKPCSVVAFAPPVTAAALPTDLLF